MIAKEAVVGKVPWAATRQTTFSELEGRVVVDRADQAYGFELVHQGFVVLAPDSINCGERNIEAIREVGQNRICHQIIDPHLGREAQFKRVFDGLRAVDVLQSLDFVDSEKIGAIGHSMGAEDVYWLMAFDDRVKAGVLGSRHIGGVAGRFYPLLAPRLFIALWAAFDCGDQQELQEAFDFARQSYEAVGAAENLLIQRLDCGHRFIDEFKWTAYKRLKEYFDILPQRSMVSLAAMVADARTATSDAWGDQHVVFPEPEVAGECRVMVNGREMTSAIAALYLYLLDRSARPELRVSIKEEVDGVDLRCCVPSDKPLPADAVAGGFETLRGVKQVVAEHDASLACNHSEGELMYTISFPRSH